MGRTTNSIEVQMGWRRDAVRMGTRYVRSRATAAVRPDAVRAQGSFTVVPEWRTVSDDGRAMRLGPRETIDVAKPIGRWQEVDPRLPTDGWARPWAVAGLVLWAGAVGVGWWRGATRGTGALRMLGPEPDED